MSLTIRPRPRPPVLPDAMTVPQLAAYLQIGVRQAYELVRDEDLAVRIGRSLRVSRRRVARWLDGERK